ncbi:hypothetical protein JCM6882_000993 [Rhodosporidiobolus microsporus]
MLRTATSTARRSLPLARTLARSPRITAAVAAPLRLVVSPAHHIQIQTCTMAAPADPYTAKSSSEASPQQKCVRKIISECKCGMLVTRASDGALHSRMMYPASHEGLVFQFVANLDSGKFDELENDDSVNISFADPSSTDWASVAGKASVVKDVETIKKLWNPTIKAWFGDLKDGVRTGEPGDPRIAVIQVVPAEIRYWVKTRTSLGQAAEVLKGAITGETAAPGVLRVLGSSDV